MATGHDAVIEQVGLCTKGLEKTYRGASPRSSVVPTPLS